MTLKEEVFFFCFFGFPLFNPSEKGRTRASGWEQKPDVHSEEVENMHILTVRCDVITRNNYEGEHWLLHPWMSGSPFGRAAFVSRELLVSLAG